MATNQLISTMATPLLVYGCTAVFEAIDPTDGSTVAGVVIGNPVISGVNLSVTDATDTGPQVGPFMLVPGPGE